MRKLINIIMCLSSVWAIAPASVALASDPCADYCDYLCRHHRTDVKAVSARSWLRNAGDFMTRSLSIEVKNSGTQPIGLAGSSQSFKVAVAGYGTRWVSLRGELQPGDTQWVGFGRVPMNLEHCQAIKVAVDTGRDLSQWGCNVFRNDTQIMPAKEAGAGTRCLRDSPQPNPRPWPRP